MRVRWTTPAAQDLYNIVRRIQQDSSDAAATVAKTLYDGCGSLGNFPRRGRKGRIAFVIGSELCAWRKVCSWGLGRPAGTFVIKRGYPALKRGAKLGRPSGAGFSDRWVLGIVRKRVSRTH